MNDILKPPQQESVNGFLVFDYITPVAKALEQSTPLPGEVEEKLADYDVKFDLQEYVNEVGGKENALARVNSALEIFNEFDLAGRIDRIVERIEQIQPGQSLEPVPIKVGFVGDRGEGRSFEGTAIAVNMGGVAERLRRGVVSAENVDDRIEAICVHEGIHVFTEQLGVGSQDTNVPLMGGIWVEGLTSYMVPELLGDLSIPDDELEFWIGVLNKWVQTKDQSERKKVVRELLDTKGNDFIEASLIETSLARLNEDEYPTVILSNLLMRSKGILYRIGFEMWKHRIVLKRRTNPYLT
jgi:hypothetical protein